MLNKKSNLTYCQVRENYEHFRSRCTEEKPKLFNYTKKEKRLYKTSLWKKIKMRYKYCSSRKKNVKHSK